MTNSTQWGGLPVQSAPVDRSMASAARNGTGGIEPSDWFSDLLGTVGPAIPGILGALGV